MPAQQILRTFVKKLDIKDTVLVLGLFGLAVAGEFIENDFVCPCEDSFRILFFTLYLCIPAFVSFTVTYCIMRALENRDSEENRESDGTARARTAKKDNRFCFIVRCCIPSIFWMAMFFGDGRFIACVATTLKGGYADSSPLPAWEWCDKNRTLTLEQRYAEQAFYYSKIAGFGVVLALSFIVLGYMCCKNTSNNQENQPETVELSSIQAGGS